MDNNILKAYAEFVKSRTNIDSTDFDSFVARLHTINLQSDVNLPSLITAAHGLPAESGEFADIVKKIQFQGKELSEETIVHLKKELGDVIFYWFTACRALNVNPEDIIKGNIEKLSARYPDGFSVQRSENKKKGDI